MQVFLCISFICTHKILGVSAGPFNSCIKSSQQ